MTVCINSLLPKRGIEMEKKCECGCGQVAKEGNRFVRGHHGRCFSEATRRKIGNAMKGKKNPMYGRTGTKSHLYGKIGDEHPAYGTHRTKKENKKNSEAHKRKNLSEETLIKKSESQKKYAREHPDKVREICRKATLARRENSPYWFADVSFDSREEACAMKILCERFVITPIEGINCHIRVNGGEIDFRPTESLFIEYHPWDRKLSHEQYYNARRKLLDENRYQDCKLIVAKSLNEVKKVS